MQTDVGDKLAVVPDFKIFYHEHIFRVEFEIGETERTISFDRRFSHDFYAVEHFFTRISHARRGSPRSVFGNIILHFFNFGLLAVVSRFVLLVEHFALL